MAVTLRLYCDYQDLNCSLNLIRPADYVPQTPGLTTLSPYTVSVVCSPAVQC